MHSERPKLCAILAFLSAIGLTYLFIPGLKNPDSLVQGGSQLGELHTNLFTRHPLYEGTFWHILLLRDTQVSTKTQGVVTVINSHLKVEKKLDDVVFGMIFQIETYEQHHMERT